MMGANNLIYTVMFGFLLLACNKDDGPRVDAPQLDYGVSTVEVAFVEQGEVLPISLNWGGQTGELELTGPIDGVALDTDTERLKWNGNLSIGLNEIIVRASNKGGFTHATVVLDHKPHGEFNGYLDQPDDEAALILMLAEDHGIRVNINGTAVDGIVDIDYDNAQLTASMTGIYNPGGDVFLEISYEMEAKLVYKIEDLNESDEPVPYITGNIWQTGASEKHAFKVAINKM